MTEDLRLVLCETCGSEGRILRQCSGCWSCRYDAPCEIDEGECECCEGTGAELIETDPIDEEDLERYAPDVPSEPAAWIRVIGDPPYGLVDGMYRVSRPLQMETT